MNCIPNFARWTFYRLWFPSTSNIIPPPPPLTSQQGNSSSPKKKPPSSRRVAVNIFCARWILLPVTHLVAILGGEANPLPYPVSPLYQAGGTIPRKKPDSKGIQTKKTWRNQKKKRPFFTMIIWCFFCLTSIFSSYLRWHVRWSSMIYHPLEVGVKAPKGEWYSWVAQSGNSEKIITRTYAGKRHALQFIQKPIAVEASPSMECNSCPHGLGLMFASMYEFQSQAKHSCSAWHQFFWSRG